MAVTTSRGLVVVTGADAHDIPAALQALADSYEGPCKGAGGSVGITVTGASFGTAAITFPVGKFTHAPLCFPNIVAGSGTNHTKLSPRIYSITTAGATIGVYTGDSSTVTASVTVQWEAFQNLTTAAAG